MKKKICIVLLFIMCGFIFFYYEVLSSPVVKVITNNNKTNDCEYYIAYSNNTAKKTDAFDGDHAEIYTAAHSCFSSYIDNNKVKNSLNEVVLKDASGNIVENDDTITAIMQKAANQINHEILQLKIMKDDNEYFVVVKLNVNLYSPCDLYKYNLDKKTLKMIHSWNEVDIVDLSIR